MQLEVRATPTGAIEDRATDDRSEYFCSVPLEVLIARAVESDNLRMEDASVEELKILMSRLRSSIDLVQGVLEGLAMASHPR